MWLEFDDGLCIELGGLYTISFTAGVIQWRLTDTVHAAIWVHFTQNKILTFMALLYNRQVHVSIPCGRDIPGDHNVSLSLKTLHCIL